MLRLFLLPALLFAGAVVSATGCRSCSTCHDYDPPVACCQCGACDGHRSGSAFAGYPNAEGFDYEDKAVLQQPAGVSTGSTCPCQSGN